MKGILTTHTYRTYILREIHLNTEEISNSVEAQNYNMKQKRHIKNFRLLPDRTGQDCKLHIYCYENLKSGTFL